MLLFSGSRANRFLLRLNRLMCIWRLNIRDYLGAYGSSTFRKRVSFYGAMPPAFVFGKDRFARAAIAGLFRSGPAHNVGGVAPGNKSQLPEGRRPSAHRAAEPRKHQLEKLCR